jgi:hypothetical protein
MNNLNIPEEPIAPKVAFIDDAPPVVDTLADKREEAFDRQFCWRGKPLYPLSMGRRSEWAKLRQLVSERTAMDDVFIILHLCSTPTKDILEKRRDRVAWERDIYLWTEANVAPHELDAAQDLVNEMFEEAEATRAVPAPTDGRAPGN